MLNDFKLTENFNLKEFQCKCCQKVKLEKELIEKLQKLRVLTQKPIQVLSGYRCLEYNTKVGGAKESYHMKGFAADIRIAGYTVNQVAELAEKVGFNGIGKYYDDAFVHVDVRGEKARWQE